MNLSSNEKEVMKLLLSNARATDTKISHQIGLSTTGVGKIRKKLESKGLIEKYGVELDMEALGLNVLTVVRYRVLANAWEAHGEDVNNILASSHNCVGCIRLQGGGATHLVMYVFSDVHSAESYLNAVQSELYDYLEVGEVSHLLVHDILKNDTSGLVASALDMEEEA
ncbi:MAG: Lrp/AsnC family transcriptional regulator [Methermicoccaceae archaeon]